MCVRTAVAAIATIILVCVTHRCMLKRGTCRTHTTAGQLLVASVPDVRRPLGPGAIRSVGVRLVLLNISTDPAWGPYAQDGGRLAHRNPRCSGCTTRLKKNGVRWITWIEAFGDCVMYAGALERRPDGSFVTRPDEPDVATLQRIAWNWESQDPPPGNTFRWVGLHNTANDEDFVQPLFSKERTGFPDTHVSRWPTGRWLASRSALPRQCSDL